MTEDDQPDIDKEEERTWGDKMLVEGRELSPRHRKLAELAAQGIRNQEIARLLDYTDSRVSILLTNTKIKAEVDRIRERIFEETVAGRLKKMAEPALNEIDRCLNDKTNRYKEVLKVETAKWVVEKLDGKPMQKHDVSSNLLSTLMDKLDGLKNTNKTIEDLIDVTPLETESTTQAQLEAPKVQEISDADDYLRDWTRTFTAKRP